MVATVGLVLAFRTLSNAILTPCIEYNEEAKTLVILRTSLPRGSAAFLATKIEVEGQFFVHQAEREW